MEKRIRAGLVAVLAGIIVLVGVLVPTMAPFAAPSGPGPDHARPVDRAWRALNPGQSPWYVFYYAGDGSPVSIRMQVVPEGGASFALWTPEQIDLWSRGFEVDPVGRGSTDPFSPGDQVWTGSFQTPGAYHLVAEHTGDPGTSYYMLDVSGDGVRHAPPAPQAPTSEPAPVQQGKRTKAPAKPSGKLVFQTSFGGDLYTINVNGKGLRRITSGTDPAWSPSSSSDTKGEQQIAFTRWREPRGVWVVNADGTGEQRVFDWGETRWPSWSADGSRILFSRQEGGRTEDVERCFWGFCFTMPAHPQWRLGAVYPDDGAFDDVPASKWSLAPHWSPVDSSIVYSDEHGLRIQSEDETYTFQLTSDPMDTSPVWSPASTGADRIAFVRRQHDHWEIYRVDADGANLTRLTETPRKPGGGVGNSVAPAWSPDGAHVAFLTDRTGRWEIWVMRANGGEQKPMFAKALDGLVLDYGFVADSVISWTE